MDRIFNYRGANAVLSLIKKPYIIIALVLLVASCALVDDIGEYAQKNDFVVNLAVSQGVMRYIDSGDTEQDKQNRQDGVIRLVDTMEQYIDGNPSAVVGTIFEVLIARINWDAMSDADQSLVRDIIGLVELKLEEKQQDGVLSPDAIIGLKSLLQTARNAAQLGE
jgi:hypothetical protein